MDRKKIFRAANIRAANIGREYFCYEYKVEIIANVLIFVIFWSCIVNSLSISSEQDIFIYILNAFLIVFYLLRYSMNNFIYNIFHKIKKYNRHEEISAIIDFLPMTRREKNLSNFLINYRKSINLIIPYIIMYMFELSSTYPRGIFTVNVLIIMWCEGFRNIFIKKSILGEGRKKILLCDLCPVIMYLLSIIISYFYELKYVLEFVGSFHVGITLGIVSFIFIIYTSYKYRES